MCECRCKPVSFIKNPDQLEFAKFDTRFPDSYKDGFETGILWDGNWMPGGPHAYNKASKDKAALWHSGFSDGLELNFKSNPDFAEWFKVHRRKLGYHNYRFKE